MRLILLSILVLLTYTYTSAQERQDRPAMTFLKKSERLTSADGWRQNTSGKWILHQNVISPDEDFDTSQRQNFYWLQSASLDYNNKKYYVIFYERLSGFFRYPEIREDWRSFNNVPFLILDNGEYQSLKASILKKEGKTISNTSKINISDFNEGDYDEAIILQKINKVLGEDHKYNQACFYINSQVSKGQEIVRFYLPSSCDSSVKDYLKDRYFEVPLAEFKKLLID